MHESTEYVGRSALTASSPLLREFRPKPLGRGAFVEPLKGAVHLFVQSPVSVDWHPRLPETTATVSYHIVLFCILIYCISNMSPSGEYYETRISYL